MKEYIDREEAIAWFMPYVHAGESIEADVVISDIKDMKAADVEPVRHGRWIAKQTALGTKYTVCSNCRYGISVPLDGHLSKLDLSDVLRCPNCGAYMDEEEKE